MAFVQNSSQQYSFSDSLSNLTDRERKRLENSWAVPFSKHIFSHINEERFSVLYSDDPASRPNTPINVIVGMLIIKDLRNLTDEQCIEALMFDISVQYALHTTSFEEQPISDRTLSRFREKCERYLLETEIDLMKEEILSLAEYQRKLLKISPAVKRMDSLMVDSSCKKMSRLELLYSVTCNVVNMLIKMGFKDLLDDKLMTYAKDSDKNDVCYRLEKEQVNSKMEEIVQDALKVREICELVCTEPGQLEGCKEYRLLVRMLSDQTEEKDGETVLKAGKDISTTSLQNPSDEDATFRTKAGKDHQGYVGNIVETCDENGNVITSFDIQPNIYSDEQFAEDVINELGNNSGTEIITNDGAFTSTNTIKLAEENGILQVSGKMTGPQTKPMISDFVQSEETKEILECPAGCKPISSRYDKETGTATAHFQHTDCDNCPLRNECPGKNQKKSVVVKITDKQKLRATQMRKMKEEQYKALINKRNGVEGLPSLLRRKYNVDHMPIRGLPRVKIWYALKIAAINDSRLIAAMRIA